MSFILEERQYIKPISSIPWTWNSYATYIKVIVGRIALVFVIAYKQLISNSQGNLKCI